MKPEKILITLSRDVISPIYLQIYYARKISNYVDVEDLFPYSV